MTGLAALLFLVLSHVDAADCTHCETTAEDDALLSKVELLQTHLDLQKKPVDANSSKEEKSTEQLEDVVAAKLQEKNG